MASIEEAELANRSLGIIIIEASLCLVMNAICLIGNIMVCVAVYRNPKLRSTTNLYIIALAASDLLCATVEMPLTSATLIMGRWVFSDALCQLQAFVDVFITYVTPATMGLTAFNRYMRIVKSHSYNKFFSPQRSKIWLACLWISLALYLLICRVTNWQNFEFDPGYAFCSVTFHTTTGKTIHYCLVLTLFFIIPFSVAMFSYYKIFRNIRRHKLNVAHSLQSADNPGRISAQEINATRVLSFVIAGFAICWVPLWGFLFWKRFSPETAPRIVELFVTVLIFLSCTINPFIYAATNRVFRAEFRKMLFFWRNGQISPNQLCDSVAAAENQEKGRQQIRQEIHDESTV